jgi:VWFA-related protein
MFTRVHVLHLAYIFLLSWVSAFGQTGDISSPGTQGHADPGLVPFTYPSSKSTITAPVTATSADREGKVKFHVQTVLVEVPMVVTDKSGNHIHGLTKEDFHLFESGKEQRIATFEEVVTTETKLSVSEPRKGEFTNLGLSDGQPRNTTVIALDNINTPFLNQYSGRSAVMKYLAENLDPGLVLGLVVMTSRGIEVIQGLTGDREQLVQALKQVSGEMSSTQGLTEKAKVNAAVGDIPETPSLQMALSKPFAAAHAYIEYGDTFNAELKQPEAFERTLNAFLEIAWSLSGVPGRKSLIWATGGFPFQIASPAQVPGRGDLASLYERTIQALTAAQISVYPVDVRGLVENTSMVIGSSSGQKLANQISDINAMQQSTIDTLNQLADMTGGRAFYNSNDLATSFKRAVEDASSYYLATYYLDTHNNNAGWRELRVRTDRKGLEIRAREGFFVTNATMNPDVTRTADLAYALASPIEGTGVPMSVKWLGVSSDGARKRAEFIVHMPAGGISIEAANGQNHLNFDYAAAAYINDGKASKAAFTTSKTVAPAVPDAQMAPLRNNGIDMKGALELAPGQYTVRVVIRDNVTGKIGSVTAPLVVN